MTEQELKQHQLQLVAEFTGSRMVNPCLTVKKDRNGEAEPKKCEFLEIGKGCTIGFEMQPNKSVSCPIGKGEIAIGAKIEEVLRPHQIYALEIASMQNMVPSDAVELKESIFL